MSASIFSGPLVSAGPMMGQGTSQDYSAEFGPSLEYQASGLIDVRFNVNKDNTLPGSVRAFCQLPFILSIDAAPSTLSASNLCAAQTATSGTALTLAAASTGVATNVPFINYLNNAATANIALDFGFTTGSFTASSKNVTVSDSSKFQVGMPLVCANVGNAAGTSALLTFVKSITSTTVIVLNDAALATNATAPIGTGNNWGPQGLDTYVPLGAWPYLAAGLGMFFDPTQAVSRGWRVVSNNGADSGWTVTAAGYDIYGYPQTETVTVTAGGTAWGKKTFKYFTSFTPTKSGSTTGTLSIGTSDVFGSAVRMDRFEYANLYWAGASITSTGWTAADTTSPATATTGDVRGTIQIGTNGPLGGGATGGSSNGTLRLCMFYSLPLYNLTQATPSYPAPIFGVTPV